MFRPMVAAAGTLVSVLSCSAAAFAACETIKSSTVSFCINENAACAILLNDNKLETDITPTLRARRVQEAWYQPASENQRMVELAALDVHAQNSRIVLRAQRMPSVKETAMTIRVFWCEGR